MSDFADQYGPWALVAGGAQGIGEAYSRYAAARGLNVVVIDNNPAALESFSQDLSQEFGVECLPIHLDLSAPDMLDQVIRAVGDRAIGLMVYNAGLADVGPFYKPDTGLAFEQLKIAVNVTGPLLLTYHFAKPMLQRQRGGIVLMSSGAGLKGAPYYAHYSATKSYEITLAQALWAEFKPYNVDVLAVAGGMTLSTAAAGFEHLDTSTFQTPAELVDEAMAELGKQSLIISEASHRENALAMKQLPDEELIGFLKNHAVDNFFGGEVPEQVI